MLLLNLATDAEDPVLGFTTAWIRALAARCASVDVVTVRAGRVDVPANVRVHSLGKERGFSVPRRVLELQRLLFVALRARAFEVCFSHMAPALSVLAAPALRLRGVPLVTWYTHPALSPTLKLAHWSSCRMVTALATSYPYRRDKLLVIGHGIDTDLFTPGEATAEDRGLILCVGRLSAAKRQDVLIEAAGRLRHGVPDARLALVGGPATEKDRAYVADLRARVARLGLEDAVTFVGPLPPPAVVAWYRRCAVHVNLAPAGFGDKAALEAMSCARPTIVAGDGFADTLGPHAERLTIGGDAPALAERLEALLRLTAAQRARIGADLRQRVRDRHGLEGLADRLVDVLSAEAARAGRG